jgi:hypothetical protein
LAENLPDAIEIGADLLDGQELAGFVLERGIADLGGAAAHECDRPVAGFLQPAQHHDLHQGTRMEAWRRRIETDIAGDAPAMRGLVERLGIGHLMHETALRQHIEKSGLELAHRGCSP